MQSTQGTDYVLGIDTGGTYTDAVLLNHATRKVLTSAKTLTTYDHLARGITRALEDLQIRDPSKVKLVGISSTLATNSLAEGKRRRVGLVLIGYDPGLIASYDLQSRFVADTFAYFAGGHDVQGFEQGPLDVAGIRKWVGLKAKELDALAISSYFSPLNASHEQLALRVVREGTSIPVVLGHQLSTRLDSIKRATTASLNASLVAVMREFIQAVKNALKNKGILAPLMVVKGDGSLMPCQEAVQKPVETILSGPAASAIAGRFFSGEGSALIIDLGGTTMDMALLERGRVSVSDQGARVGRIQTAVRAARIRTVGLGCDSRIRVLSGHEFCIGPDRVVPLCRLASSSPEVEGEITALSRKREKRSLHDLEYWFLAREMEAKSFSKSPERIKGLIRLLEQGPRSVSSMLRHTGVHHLVQLGLEDMLQQGYLGRSALTATDLLHVQGRMDLWSSAAARQALDYICGLHQVSSQAIADKVLKSMVQQMAQEAVIFLAQSSGDWNLPEDIQGQWAEWILEQAFGGENNYLSVAMSSRFPIIGIGAPAEILVKEVAEHLKTTFILPPHPHVANAAGAVAGSVVVSMEAIVYLQERGNMCGYAVNFQKENETFHDKSEALDYARKRTAEAAERKALGFGADNPEIHLETTPEGGLLRIRASAVGNPTLHGPNEPTAQGGFRVRHN